MSAVLGITKLSPLKLAQFPRAVTGFVPREHDGLFPLLVRAGH